MPPLDGFEWYDGLTEEDVRNSDPDCEHGYLVEWDLEYPEELHASHSDYPLEPTREAVVADMMSPHTRELFRHVYMLKPHQKVADEKVQKLLLTLENKEKYTVHVALMKLQLEPALLLKKVHRVVKVSGSLSG